MPAGPIPIPRSPAAPTVTATATASMTRRISAARSRRHVPDPAKPGCPLSDRDHDLVPDASDACPTNPVRLARSQKNGCPGLVEAKADLLVIRQQVFYAPQKDTILKKSFKVLDAVVAALKGNAADQESGGRRAHRQRRQGRAEPRSLGRRATSVMTYLTGHGVEAARLEAHGYGPDRPIADNKAQGRALNRRTDFRILDPAIQDLSSAPTAAPAAPTPPAPAPPPPRRRPSYATSTSRPSRHAKPRKYRASPDGQSGQNGKPGNPQPPKAAAEKPAPRPSPPAAKPKKAGKAAAPSALRSRRGQRLAYIRETFSRARTKSGDRFGTSAPGATGE